MSAEPFEAATAIAERARAEITALRDAARDDADRTDLTYLLGFLDDCVSDAQFLADARTNPERPAVFDGFLPADYGVTRRPGR